MVMKIENFEGTADTFTFPNNPRSFDDSIDSNHSITPIGYQKHHIFISGGGLSPRTIVTLGHFHGANKETNFRTLTRHYQETTKLKKLYWETDKFYIGIGRQVKKTNSGGRTNFIDYNASFQTPINILFGDTLRTSGTNAGNITTFVESITGTVTNGASDVTLSDLHGTTITIPNSELTTSQNFLFNMIRMTDSGGGIFFTNYNYVGLSVDSGTTSSASSYYLVDSGQNFTSTVSVGDLVHNTTDDTYAYVVTVVDNENLLLTDDIMGSSEAFIIYTQCNKVNVNPALGLLRLRAGENVSSISTSNLTSATISFRDGYSV